MANVVYLSKTLLTGGTAPALDSIDGAGLVDGDFAHVTVAGVLYVYKLNATLGGAESIPTIITPDTNAGTKRWILQGVNANGLTDNSLTANLPLFTGASKEVVSKSVADTQTALAITALGLLANGAANTKTFMNAAGTAPEWASGFKIITGSRVVSAADADVPYIGVGFKPSALIAFALIDATPVGSVGFSDSAKTNYTLNIGREAVTGILSSNNTICYLYTGVGSAEGAIIKSYDADGFTLTWTKAGSPTGTANLYFLCLR